MSPLSHESWQPENVRKLQLEDANIGPILKCLEQSNKRPTWAEISENQAELKILWANRDRLKIQHGVLYRHSASKNSHYNIVVPACLRRGLLEYSHDLPTSGHLCAEKCMEKIKRQFYWPKLKAQVHEYVQRCDKCAARKMTKSKFHAQLGRFIVGEPMERIAMDILGPLPITEEGNRYVLVIMDLFTKWTEAYPLKDQEARTVATVFVNEFITRYGTPLQVLTDQGTNFESRLFREVCELLQIDKTRTSSYHPQSNGSVERFNRTLAIM